MERKAKENESLYNREKNSNQELRNKLSSTASQLERLVMETKNNDGKKSR